MIVALARLALAMAAALFLFGIVASMLAWRRDRRRARQRLGHVDRAVGDRQR